MINYTIKSMLTLSQDKQLRSYILVIHILILSILKEQMLNAESQFAVELRMDSPQSPKMQLLSMVIKIVMLQQLSLKVHSNTFRLYLKKKNQT